MRRPTHYLESITYNTKNGYIYAVLREEKTNFLSISATLDYILQAVVERDYVLRGWEFNKFGNLTLRESNIH